MCRSERSTCCTTPENRWISFQIHDLTTPLTGKRPKSRHISEDELRLRVAVLGERSTPLLSGFRTGPMSPVHYVITEPAERISQ